MWNTAGWRYDIADTIATVSTVRRVKASPFFHTASAKNGTFTSMNSAPNDSGPGVVEQQRDAGGAARDGSARP